MLKIIEIIGELIRGAGKELYQNLSLLLQGEEIQAIIDTDIIYPEVNSDPDIICSFLLVAGYLPGSDKVSEVANGRLALWKVTILTYGKEGLLFQIFGMGPDSFYYALYQWGSDAMDWINRGLLDNNIYSNAHNEWLTLLVQQGILGVIAYGGIFLTAFRNLRISATRDPRALAVFLGLTGYLICSLFTFQHVLSTPFAFALLGMAEGVLCKVILIKS